eukprot:SAG22_NODE_2639_length_2347_cov_2.181940_2_plen_165_part_00
MSTKLAAAGVGTFSMDSTGSGALSPRYPSGSVRVLNDRFCTGIAMAKADAAGITRAAFVPNVLLNAEFGSFTSFAQGPFLVPFWRSLLDAVHGEMGLEDYHLRVWPILQRGSYAGLAFDSAIEAAAQEAGFFVEIFADSNRTGAPPKMENAGLGVPDRHSSPRC